MTALAVGGMLISTERGVAARFGVAVTNAAVVTMTTVARAGDLVLGLWSTYSRGNTVEATRKELEGFATRNAKKDIDHLVAVCARRLKNKFMSVAV